MRDKPRTVSEWLENEDALDEFIVRVEAGLSRRRLAQLLDPDQRLDSQRSAERIAEEEFDRFTYQTMGTCCRVTFELKRMAPDREVAPIDLVGLCLWAPEV